MWFNVISAGIMHEWFPLNTMDGQYSSHAHTYALATLKSAA
jgi:hypothetical protein